ncbi:hypothetical protein ACCAA_370017 [Candidatus Accumulibacter aalborgensis]|uniref:Uncharacterized protein n=1 Tax=Candidatus Accumulibacter aalborgensis TaxID=1860102 RepID=A0A1A8XSL5_9PROT|nr:hypothetical protein ACCAA_370017 [Candidatus Accumulibacter aalborgensis]
MRQTSYELIGRDNGKLARQIKRYYNSNHKGGSRIGRTQGPQIWQLARCSPAEGDHQPPADERRTSAVPDRSARRWLPADTL